MIINTAFAMLILFGGGIISVVITWPDVPWTMLTFATTAATVLLPIWFYPMSKTIWLAVDLIMTGMDPARRQ